MIGENIKRFRLLRGMSLRKLGELVNMSQTAVNKYEKNILQADGEKLVLFAKALDCDVVDLIKENSNKRILNLNFRKRKSLSGRKLELLKEMLNTKVNNYLDVLELNNISKINLNKYKVSSYTDAEVAASKFRNDNNLNELLPLVNLCNVIENLGIIVIIFDNKDEEFDGFDGVSEIVDNTPFICISKDKNYYRQRFTLAHELGHLLLDIDKELDEEKVCNEFASSLLLPRKAMEAEFGRKRLNISNQEYEIVREEYGVSIKAIIYKLEKYGIISSNYAKISYINYNKIFKEDEMKQSLNKIEESKKYQQLTLRLLNQDIITISRFNELNRGWIYYD